MGKYDAKTILLARGKKTASVEENDLNINIQAQHEGEEPTDAEPADLGEFDNSAPAEAEPAVEPIDTPAPEETEALAVDTSGVPETAELDVVEAGEEVAAASDKMEEATDVVEGLEHIAVTLATMSVEGIEMTPFMAETLRSQYNHVTRKFPKMKIADNLSVESLTGGETPVLSLESVGDKVKKGLAAAWRWLKETLQKFAAMLGHATSAAAVMGRKAKAISSEASNKAVEPAKLPKLLSGADVTVESINALATLLNNLGTQTYGEAVRIYKESSFKELFNGAGAEESLDILLSGGSAKYLKDVVGKTLVGGIKVVASETSYYKVEHVEGADDKKLAAPAASTIKSLAEANAKLASAIDGFKRTQNMRRGFEAQLEAVSKNVDADATFSGIVRKSFTIYAQIRAFERAMLSRAISTGNAINNVLAASLVEKK